jgi:23S rRNA (adenine2503-C2)-methyltransferase
MKMNSDESARVEHADAMNAMPLLEATREGFVGWMASQGEAAYRADQVWRWVFQGRVETFEGMSDLPRRLRERLSAEWVIFTTAVARHEVSPDGTDKLVLRCGDGNLIECVLMREGIRRTVCLSTQVGCGMGCVFCASGLKGLIRNLTRGEILEQVLRLSRLLPEGERVSHVVVMGMGESLANLENLIPALDWICSPRGLGLSQRRVTISTVGLPEKIRKLAELNRSYHLAVSLHAATEALRDELVPINEKVGLTAVLEAADAYFERTGRQVTYEYTLLGGVNDRAEDAAALGRLLRKRRAHVNLIPYNPVEGLAFERPSEAAIARFVERLRGDGVSVTGRKTKGRPIDAACGQLRRRVEVSEDRAVLDRGGSVRS